MANESLTPVANQKFLAEKRCIGDLACLGGSPLFADALHVTRPNVGDRERFSTYIDGIWTKRWFTNDGPLVSELERRLEDRLEVDHCVLTSNGTAAMALAIRALDLVGDVILPAFTFISTAHALLMAGIKPIFADIEDRSWGLDASKCRDLLTPDTSAIIATHLFGTVADIDRLEDLSREVGIPLLWDSAHAFGCTHEGRPVGSFGTAEIFSFHATKAFHTFEGGAITTGDADLAARLRKMRNFGFSGYDEVEMIGTNAKMSEVHAAMGLTNLNAFDEVVAANWRCHGHYRSNFADISGISVHAPEIEDGSNFHYFVAEIDADTFGLTRDQLLSVLHAENIVARRYFYPGTHRCEPYRTLYPDAGDTLPKSNALIDRIIQFPAGVSVTEHEIGAIGDLLQFVSTNARAIADRIAQNGRPD